MNNEYEQPIYRLKQLQNKLELLKQKISNAPSAPNMTGNNIQQVSRLHQLSKGCESFNTKISIFNNGLIKLADSFNTNIDTAHHMDFMQTLLKSIPEESANLYINSHANTDTNTTNMNANTDGTHDKNHHKQNQNKQQEHFVPLLHFKETDFYKNNQLNIMTDDTIIVLDRGYTTNAKVLVKRLPDLEIFGHCIIDQDSTVLFKEKYLESLDKLLNGSSITILSINPVILNELFALKRQQFNEAISSLSKTLNVDKLDCNNRNDKITLDAIATYKAVFNQMQEVLQDCTTSISAVI
jgi:hypothetical protein